MKLVPRNNMVIFRRVNRGKTATGIIMPDKSLEGIDHIVVAVGPQVEGLKEGDKILVMGGPGQDYGQLPNMKNYFLTKQENVALIYEWEPEDFGGSLPLPAAVQEGRSVPWNEKKEPNKTPPPGFLEEDGA